jgi:hypothetical protein
VLHCLLLLPTVATPLVEVRPGRNCDIRASSNLFSRHHGSVRLGRGVCRQTSLPFVHLSLLSFHLLVSHLRIIIRAFSIEQGMLPCSSEVGAQFSFFSQSGLLLRFQVGPGSTVETQCVQSAGLGRLKPLSMSLSMGASCSNFLKPKAPTVRQSYDSCTTESALFVAKAYLVQSSTDALNLCALVAESITRPPYLVSIQVFGVFYIGCIAGSIGVYVRRPVGVGNDFPRW